jgi:hypothetical protein
LRNVSTVLSKENPGFAIPGVETPGYYHASLRDAMADAALVLTILRLQNTGPWRADGSS